MEIKFELKPNNFAYHNQFVLYTLLYSVYIKVGSNCNDTQSDRKQNKLCL